MGALQGAVDGGAADGEDLHQLGDRVVASGVHAGQLGLLAGSELGLPALEPSWYSYGATNHGWRWRAAKCHLGHPAAAELLLSMGRLKRALASDDAGLMVDLGAYWAMC